MSGIGPATTSTPENATESTFDDFEFRCAPCVKTCGCKGLCRTSRLFIPAANFLQNSEEGIFGNHMHLFHFLYHYCALVPVRSFVPRENAWLGSGVRPLPVEV